jgi:hypothetical protein
VTRRALALLAALVAALVLAIAPALADAFLRLTDGRVLEGLDVRRDGDVYLLSLPGDTVVPVPVSLVAEVGIRGAKQEPASEVPTGLTAAEPRQLAGSPPTAVPTGLTYSEPRQLAGQQVKPTTPNEQLAVFGNAAQFQPSVVTTTLGPTYWVPDPAQNNWAPSQWAKAPIDSEWHPTSAYDPEANVMAGSESKFANSIIDSSWTPTDGFAKK